MAFIGVIADDKHEAELKRILVHRLNIPNKEHTVITIHKNNIENIKNIRFETILVMELEHLEEQETRLNDLLKKVKYLVINADMNQGFQIIKDIKLNMITFGFNSKSTITASSVENNFLVCLQRNIIDINQNILEPQEIEVKVMDKRIANHSHNLMGIASVLLIYGKREIIF